MHECVAGDHDGLIESMTCSAALSQTKLSVVLQALRETIASSWARVQPILDAARQTHKLQPITQNDWRWAYGMVLSRALAVPVAENRPQQTVTCLVPGVAQVHCVPEPICSP